MKAFLAILLLCYSLNVIALDSAVNLLKDEEGYRNEVYIDTEGYPTIGYGFKVTPGMSTVKMSRSHANVIISDKVRAIHERLSSNATYMKLPKNKRRIIISMVYQMGYAGVMQFRDMWAALKIEDYEGAGEAMKDSLWYKQTPNRANRHINVIKGQ